MTRRLSSIALFAAIALGAGRPATGSPTTDVIDALSGVDFLPGVTRLTAILGDDLSVLADVANGELDPGVRIRAYRSLGQFPVEEARLGIKEGIDRYRTATAGTELLYLAAATEALGESGGPADVPLLAPILDAPSRDLRVVVARALGRIGGDLACALLRARRDVEQVDQVRIEIDEASAACAR
ncbi:MAG: HEAT repeat domain-containing protein [Kofleriaceae bacterium]|nr:HEAT repeat domain-containing protein [Kofleriaceae bacterium]MCL4226805.1 HEAT repeat domain-containing protein [Myxococcales bacterium]